MITKRKICIIAPSLRAGGIERQLSLLSSHFAKRGNKVTYISCRKGEHFYSLDPSVKFVEPPFVHTTSRYKKILSYIRTVLFIRHEIIKCDPETIMVFGDIINPIALIANKGLKYPIYIADQISPLQPLGFFKNMVKKITYPWATGIIAQSNQAAKYKYKVFGPQINLKIIPNSIHEIKQYKIKKQNWVVGVGRLSYEKGFDRLLLAFAKIQDHDEWSLVIAGSGPEYIQLIEKTKELGLSKRVKFLGMIKDVDKLLSQSKIFVIPSRYEGFPNSLIEAMATPLPCISFDSISVEDLITNGVDGIVVKDGDVETLAKKIEKLMNDEPLRKTLAENAESIKKRLDKNKVGDKFLSFIFSFEDNHK